MNANDGGPAFPISKDTVAPNGHSGMSLRDYFAAAALPECLAYWRRLTPNAQDKITYTQMAYDAADAMLKEREK